MIMSLENVPLNFLDFISNNAIIKSSSTISKIVVSNTDNAVIKGYGRSCSNSKIRQKKHSHQPQEKYDCVSNPVKKNWML
jgi:hypothetical protein